MTRSVLPVFASFSRGLFMWSNDYLMPIKQDLNLAWTLEQKCDSLSWTGLFSDWPPSGQPCFFPDQCAAPGLHLAAEVGGLCANGGHGVCHTGESRVVLPEEN